jgi:protein SCO1
MRIFLTGIIVALIAIIIWAAAFWQPAGTSAITSDTNPSSPSHALMPASGMGPGGQFTLQSAAGPVSLSDLRGKLVLIYFGYTYCPDICPTSLAATVACVKQLTADEQARVAIVFISVDPGRDTPARLKTYVEFFHPQMLGLTGDAANLAEIARRYGVFYAFHKSESAAGSYVVDHSADTYVVGQEGALLDRIAHETAPEKVAATLRKYLR